MQEPTIKIECVNCQQTNHAPAYKQGLWLQCRQCRTRLAIPIRSNFAKRLKSVKSAVREK